MKILKPVATIHPIEKTPKRIKLPKPPAQLKSSNGMSNKSNLVKWIENFYRRANGKKGIKYNGKEVLLSVDDLILHPCKEHEVTS